MDTKNEKKGDISTYENKKKMVDLKVTLCIHVIHFLNGGSIMQIFLVIFISMKSGCENLGIIS